MVRGREWLTDGIGAGLEPRQDLMGLGGEMMRLGGSKRDSRGWFRQAKRLMFDGNDGVRVELEHDLRGLLTLGMVGVDLLKRGEGLNGERQAIADRVRSARMFAQAVVEHAGSELAAELGWEIPRSKARLGSLFSSLTELVRPLAGARKIHWMGLAEAEGWEVRVYKPGLMRAWWEIFNDISKYARVPGRELEIRVGGHGFEGNDGRRYGEVIIVDNGGGFRDRRMLRVNGQGIQRLLEPGVTSGNGSGLGGSMMHRVVCEQHGGKLWAMDGREIGIRAGGIWGIRLPVVER